MRRYFLLSPALCSGIRAGYLFNPAATFPLARKFHTRGLALGEAFTFMSGLYFRGKLAYAHAFGRPADGSTVRVIAPGAGLISPDAVFRPEELLEVARVPVDLKHAGYRTALNESAERLARELRGRDQVVLLGSIATGKYLEVLLEVFRKRLFFPLEFMGRGDMSRGALMLRCASAGKELTYVPAAEARIVRARR